jgi:hypothetical protein
MMNLWNDLFARTIRSALIPATTTAVVVGACGQAEQQNGVAPINAISHIVWGDLAAREESITVRHTLVGGALNTAAVIAWTGLYEAVFGKSARQGNVRNALLGGAATAALAYVTDYHIVPERFTPGFEKRLSSKSLLLVYGTLALSIPLGSLLERNGR